MMNSRPTRKNDKKGPMNKLAQAFAKLAQSKVFLSIISVVAAFVIWAVMMASDETLTRHKTFTGATVGITGESTLISRGYIVTDDITQIVPTVDMVVEVTQANYNRVTASSYNPHFDLTQVTGEGENNLSIVFSSTLYGQVISCEPNTVTVNVERYITRRVPVVLELTGTIPAGLYLKSYKTDPTTLSVSGPQSIVTSISRIAVKLDQSALSAERMSDRMALDIELQLSDGTAVESDKVTVTNQSVITSAVTVETELVPVKTVALDTEAFVTGTPAEGYELTAIEMAERSIDVAAAQEILDAISVITTDDPMDITDLTESKSGYVRLRRLTGIESTLPTEIAVTAVIEEQTISKTFRNIAVVVLGQDASNVELTPSRINVRINGPYSFIKQLNAEDILIEVDATDLSAGTFTLPIDVLIDNASQFTAEPDVTEIQTVIKAK